MKTIISIPDSILEAAELLASNLGMSRNELFIRAIVDFIEVGKHKDVTSQLNRVYSKIDNTLPKNLVAMQQESISRNI